MKSISAGMISALASGSTALVTMVKIERLDGVVIGLTTADSTITYDGDTYAPLLAEPSKTAQRSDMSIDSTDLIVPITDDITLADIDLGLYAGAEIWMFNYDYATPANGIIKQQRGWLGEVEVHRNHAKFEIVGMAQKLNTIFGRVCSLKCDAQLGDSRCGLDLGPFTYTGTLTGVTDALTLVDTGWGAISDSFNRGVLTMTSGAANGISAEVRTFVTGAFNLFDSMPILPAIGDTYSVVLGCDKYPETCKNTFDNFINFQGFPHVPGRDAILEVGE